MATSDEINNEGCSDKDEGGTNMSLMVVTSSDAESESCSSSKIGQRK